MSYKIEVVGGMTNWNGQYACLLTFSNHGLLTVQNYSLQTFPGREALVKTVVMLITGI